MRKLELLAKAHDRAGFDCGSEPLNAFLKQTARQHAERGISRTYVLVEEEAQEPKAILGFFSLNLCQIKSETLTTEEARRLPRDVSGADFRRAVSRIGFEFRRQRGSHMVLFRKEPPTTLVVPSHDVLKPGLLRKLIDQAGLTAEAFRELLR